MFPKINNAEVSAPPPAFPPHRALSGEHVALSPLCADDFAELYGRTHGDAARESIWAFLPYGPFASAAAMRDYYTETAVAPPQAAGGDPQFYAVRHHHDGACAGIVSYLRIAPAAYCIEIGHIWHAADRQRGRANSESAFLLMDNIFSAGYRRLEWKCNALNLRSRLAALRLGLAFEGVFRQHTVFKGKNRDSAWFALLDKDWPKVRANMSAWLKDDSGELSLTKMNREIIAWSLPAHDAWRAE